MAFFKFDSENVGSAFELVKEGKYEATIVNAVAGKTKNKDDKITVDFEIRSDVPQDHQGAKVMYNVFTFGHEISVKIANSLLKACGFPHNHEFTSAEDMANQLINKNLIITVKHEEYEATLEDGTKEKRKSGKAKYYDVSKTNPPQVPGNDPFSNNGGAIEITDDDLPF